VSRAGGRATRWFAWKAALGGAGFTVGIVGMALDQRSVIWAGVALLAGALVVRLWEARELRRSS
jgi:hypothetical protein